MLLTSRTGVAIFALFAASLPADTIRGGGRERYAVVLEDPPVAVALEANTKLGSRAGEDRRAALIAKQAVIRQAMAERKIHITSAEQMLVNAIFITADPAEAAALRELPGVRRVEHLQPLKRSANAAINLVEAPAAWARIQGGEGQAGAGVRIGIIDTGIDHRHPAFDDTGLSAPGGFPRCGPGIECGRWTNGKVIVARSYVEQLNFAFGTNPADTRPDDNSPRDRVGHGTAAAMMAAGRRVRGPSAEVIGVAPRAFLGNYKVFGSPGVNDFTYSPVIINALTDAINDGMDIVTLNLGRPALWPSLARTCGDRSNLACDIEAEAVHNATLRGLIVVAAAGNSGDNGFNYPSLGTVQSPAVAPGAIAVGATTNSHVWFQSLSVAGAGGGLNPANVRFSDGPRLRGPLTAPIRDVATIGDDTNGRACRPLPNGSLQGAIALIQRGDCERAVKVNFAQAAGAVAVVFQQPAGEDFLFTPGGLSGTGIPSALIGSTAGTALRRFLEGNRDAQGTLNPTVREVAADADFVAEFSARGPTNGDMLIKPEIVAPGTDLYMAAQNFDPNGGLYDPSGYTVSQGTSFAAPMVAGAAALVKQRFPNATPATVKSILAGSTDARLSDVNNTGNRVDARVLSVGGGRLNVNRALQTVIATEPSTISFGVIRPGPNPNTGLVVRNLAGMGTQVRVEV
ncbi:MAG: S8 family serine peptidase, partial [Bryobacteraceae bacterium]|nr:S8 family serine peptidase [Bryobacteraceae bacterium]